MDPKEIGKFLQQPSTADLYNIPVRRGGVLPVTEYIDRTEFDPSSGLTGALAEALTAPARAYRGEIPEDQMVPEAFNFAGNLTLGSLLAPRPGGSVGMGGRAAKLDMSPEARIARAKALGYDTDNVWYHGANRADRIAEKGSFDPKRATSGPMQYFTDNPELASSYAKGKADTSMQDMEDIANYFTVSSKDLGVGRADMPLERSWHFLSPEQKQTILANMKRVGYENIDEATGPFKLHPEGVDASLSGSHLDYLMKEARGNPLTALREMWYSGGDLVNNPEAMMDVWKAAGYPHKMSDKTAPWFEAPGVVPTYLKMANPLDTSNVARMRDEIIPALEQAFKSDRSRKKAYGADMWDKNTRYTPKEWVQQLKSDLETGDNSFVWTSIPDKVTNALRDLGFDGIMDVGGKGGGVGHRVAIPFSPSQIRSVNAAFDPEKAHLANLLAANAKTGAAVPLATKALEAQQPQGIRAFHGSPHDFERFDMSKIGTGEGAQAYGHGLYFADAEDVAKYYKDALSQNVSLDNKPFLNGRQVVGTTGDDAIDEILAAYEGDLGKAIQFADHPGFEGVKQKLVDLEGRLTKEQPSGHMYEVNIKANPEDFLDWDKPLSEQPKAIRDALAKIDEDLYSPQGADYDPQELGQIIYQRLQNANRSAAPQPTGNAQRDALAAQLHAMKALTGEGRQGASGVLKDAGIPGIRYLDQLSRNAGEGSSNYVLFDDALIEILRKYGLLGPVAGGGTLAGMLMGGQQGETY